MNPSNKIISSLCLAILLIISGCESYQPIKKETANRIAGPAWMVERLVAADPFTLTSYERIHDRGGKANIYIEGDGEAWKTRISQSLNPTPPNPVALHLASHDKAENVIYLARPCQYSGMIDTESDCDPTYWGDKRFAPEVIDAYQNALDDIKARYDITEFNVTGFSGGAAVAAILAAKRDDIKTLRTVAGNLDHRALSAHHQVSYMENSLNPPDFAKDLATIPQYHFIGDMDDIVPAAVLHSYLQSLGSTSCSTYKLVEDASHDAGWVNVWPELLKLKPSCNQRSSWADKIDTAPSLNIDQNAERLNVPQPIYESLPTPAKP